MVNMNNEFEKVKQKLEKYNQTNLINLLERLKNKDELIKQIQRIDFEQIMELYKKVNEHKNIDINKIEHINYVDKSKLTSEKLEEYSKIGDEVISNDGWWSRNKTWT